MERIGRGIGGEVQLKIKGALFFILVAVSTILVSCGPSQVALDDQAFKTADAWAANRTESFAETETASPTAASTITPTTTIPPSATNAQSVVVSTDTVEENDDNIIPGIIYMWDFPPYLRVMDPNEPGLIFGITQEDENIIGPNSGFSLSFPKYSDKLAYLVESDSGQIELWITDLEFKHASVVWQDTTDWLGNLSLTMLANQDQIVWGPGDNSIFIYSFLNKDRFVLYSTKSKNEYYWIGKCDQIVRIDAESPLALGCTGDLGDGQTAAIVSLDGDIEFGDFSQLIIGEEILDYAFSPDGKQVIYTTVTGEFLISKSSEATLELSLSYGYKERKPFDSDTFMDGMQWSSDGTKILVFGNSTTSEVCPLTSDGFELHCWMVIDAKSGEIIWRMKEFIANEINSSWDRLTAFYGAVLSPDARWVIISLLDSPIEYLVLVSLTSDDVVTLANYFPKSMFWTNQ